MDETLKQRVNGVIETQLAVDSDQLVDDARLVEDLGADHLDIIELVMRLEQEFMIEIDEDTETLATVADVQQLIARKTSPLVIG